MIEVSTPPVASTRPARRRWLRFSLRTLLLFTVLMASATLLWLNRFPWRLERAWNCAESSTAFEPPTQQLFFTPDGKRLVTCRMEMEIHFSPGFCGYPSGASPPKVTMWDASTGRLIWSHREKETGDRSDCVLSPGGKWVCVGRTVAGADDLMPSFNCGGGRWAVAFLNIETGKRMEMPKSLVADATSISNSPIDNPISAELLLDRVTISDDDKLAAVGWKGKIHVFNPATGTELCVLNEMNEAAIPLNFSSNNGLLAVVYGAPKDYVHDTWELGSTRLAKSVPINDEVSYVDDNGKLISPDAMENDALLQYRLAPKFRHCMPKARNRIRGREIELFSRDFSIYSTLDMAAMHGSFIQALGVDHKATSATAIAPDDSRIATLDKDGTVRVWLKHRPIGALGFAWLPEFWLAVAVGLGLVWSKWRDSRSSM